MTSAATYRTTFPARSRGIKLALSHETTVRKLTFNCLASSRLVMRGIGSFSFTHSRSQMPSRIDACQFHQPNTHGLPVGFVPFIEGSNDLFRIIETGYDRLDVGQPPSDRLSLRGSLGVVQRVHAVEDL